MHLRCDSVDIKFCLSLNPKILTFRLYVLCSVYFFFLKFFFKKQLLLAINYPPHYTQVIEIVLTTIRR